MYVFWYVGKTHYSFFLHCIVQIRKETPKLLHFVSWPKSPPVCWSLSAWLFPCPWKRLCFQVFSERMCSKTCSSFSFCSVTCTAPHMAVLWFLTFLVVLFQSSIFKWWLLEAFVCLSAFVSCPINKPLPGHTAACKSLGNTVSSCDEGGIQFLKLK